MTELNHGDNVFITQKYWRARDWQDGVRYWDFEPCNAEGLFLGYRWLSDGQMEHLGDKSVYVWHHTFKAALVSINARTNPVYVPLSAITPPTEERNTLFNHSVYGLEPTPPTEEPT